ncbi:859_t:CDS:2 [Acaulospora morrowiae]|uniref:859_t:CDS:1 n=1 Tax=Acaulospora morrowiae TaxID=94023 RepID=A0A9N8WI71_9GLOM|nr:859_t:CDS:2 [Acaulospora morrowiae]
MNRLHLAVSKSKLVHTGGTHYTIRVNKGKAMKAIPRESGQGNRTARRFTQHSGTSPGIVFVQQQKDTSRKPTQKRPHTQANKKTTSNHTIPTETLAQFITLENLYT